MYIPIETIITFLFFMMGGFFLADGMWEGSYKKLLLGVLFMVLGFSL